MISIIICSRNSSLLKKVSENVSATIGVPYEIIAIDNTNRQYSICAAYNLGAKKSKYDLLCFMHEDILFHTQNWGSIVADILFNKSIGLVGVTGSKYLVDAPAPWWGGGIDLCRRNLIDGFGNQKQERVLQNPDNEQVSEVVAVDGLWLCTRKEVWLQFPFDEQNFRDFHFYDIDFSAQVFQKYKVVVTYAILIEHFSRGNLNQSWISNAILFFQKWKQQLPMATVEIRKKEAKRIRVKAFQGFNYRLLTLNYNKWVTLKYIFRTLLFNPLNKDSLWQFKQFVKLHTGRAKLPQL